MDYNVLKWSYHLPKGCKSTLKALKQQVQFKSISLSLGQLKCSKLALLQV